MAIKNYTSTVPASQSLGEIQESLAKHGARKVMVDYDDAGEPCGITFALAGPEMGNMHGFFLPANVDGVLAVFSKQKVKADRAQAMKTAWRNLRDWVLAQMALVEAGQAMLDEVFFPYLTDGCGNTIYSAYRSGQLSLSMGETPQQIEKP